MQSRLPHPPLQMPLLSLGVAPSQCDGCVLEMTQYGFLLTIGILCLYLEKSAVQTRALQCHFTVKRVWPLFKKTPPLAK